MTDVLVYVVVLNLYVGYSDSEAIDSFTISILTALLLKGVFGLQRDQTHTAEGDRRSDRALYSGRECLARSASSKWAMLRYMRTLFPSRCLT